MTTIPDANIIEKVLIGGDNLASILLAQNISPGSVTDVDALPVWPPWIRDIWVAWKAIMDLSAVLHGEKKPSDE